MTQLLLIDDDPAVGEAFRAAFRRDPGLTILEARTAAEGLARLPLEPPAVAVLDVHLPDADGVELLGRIAAIDPTLPVLVISGAGTTETVIEAIKGGAFDYLAKPLDLGQVRSLVGQALELHRPGPEAVEPAPPGATPLLVGDGPAMQEVYKAIGRAAPRDVTVLIQGESGTGKELVAHALHRHSRRADGPYLAINCAAIPEALLESELFGHEKGAFTGADRQRPGKFEQASGGTLFLDEVGDMTPLTQAKVLRVLQEQQFERVGGSTTVCTDARVIVATHRDLPAMVAEGTFRSDLYYRLCVFTITLPPLRDRLDDLPRLADYFVSRFRAELDCTIASVAPEALDRLREYAWPGNLRELQSVLKQGMLRGHGTVLRPEFLPALDAAIPTPATSPWQDHIEARLREGGEGLHAEAIGLMERDLIARILHHTEGNLARSARILGITRNSLRNKIRALGLSVHPSH